jgi:septum formation protein
MLVLASASPRRRELLAAAGIPVIVHAAEVDETPHPGEEARAYVLRLAEAKARAAAAGAPRADLPLLAADTTVVLDGELLGKPADDAEAASMLRRLSGRIHEVWTGLCLLWPAAAQGERPLVLAADCTRVWFVPLEEAEIAAYVASGEPQGKAGAYAIQGRAGQFIPRIEGSYSNVVGLPLALLRDLLRARPAAERRP